MSTGSKRVMVLHDSPQFGGHEVIFLKIFPALLESPDISEITFCYSQSNAKLHDQLTRIQSGRLQLKPWPYLKRRAEPYLAPLRQHYARHVRSIDHAVKPDITLLLQGRIENLSVPMIALPVNRTIVSYVPMAHRLREMERNGLVGDRVRMRYYGRPNRFIVPSASVAGQLRTAGARGAAFVVENVVAPPAKLPKAEARGRCHLPDDRKIALFMGRMDVAQKGLDTLVSAIRGSRSQLSGWRFVFVGEGPGLALVQALKAEVGGILPIELVSWTDRPHEFLAAADVLLMPSRWEGVPLVMLEAMTYGLPILSSRIDVFTDFLPDGNRIDFSAPEFASRLAAATTPAAEADFARHCGVRLGSTSLDQSRERFLAALLGR